MIEYEYNPTTQVWYYLWQYFEYSGNISVYNFTSTLIIIQFCSRILDCVRNSVKPLLRKRKGENVNILCLTTLRAQMLLQPRSSFRRLLEEEPSVPLGFQLLLPVVTVTAFVTRTETF